MTETYNHTICDPKPIDWQTVCLPDTSTDQYRLSNPINFIKILFAVMQKKRRRIQLPETLINKDIIPPYALQEFHNLPNGNYSNILASGYIRGFDIVMLGKMHHSRAQIAEKLKNCQSVLDIGCGGGKTAQAISQKGITDIWGADISPYLLKQAAIRNPNIKFIHAKGEKLPFANERFDGISLCYVLHEIPPKYVKQILCEVNRLLTSGGLCVFVEPSPIHYYQSYRLLLKNHGIKSCYFRFLSHKVYEPFVESWHKTNFNELLKQNNFEVVEQIKETPNYLWVAKKK